MQLTMDNPETQIAQTEKMSSTWHTYSP